MKTNINPVNTNQGSTLSLGPRTGKHGVAHSNKQFLIPVLSVLPFYRPNFMLPISLSK